MHFLRLFLTAWLTLGTVTVFLLYWLCKRTAATVKDLPRSSGATAVQDAPHSQALPVLKPWFGTLLMRKEDRGESHEPGHPLAGFSVDSGKEPCELRSNHFGVTSR